MYAPLFSDADQSIITLLPELIVLGALGVVGTSAFKVLGNEGGELPFSFVATIFTSIFSSRFKL